MPIYVCCSLARTMIYNDRKIAIDPPHRDADDVNSFGAKLALRRAGKQGRAVFDVSPAKGRPRTLFTTTGEY